MAGYATSYMAGMRQQPEHGYIEFTPEMTSLDPEMQKMAQNKAACTARKTENDNLAAIKESTSFLADAKSNIYQ